MPHQHYLFTHSGVEVELRQVVSWSELPSVLQVESHRTCIALWRGDKTTKSALHKPHWTIIDLETSDWERSAVENKEYTMIGQENLKWMTAVFIHGLGET